MEDTIWPYPHRDDIIKSNVESFLHMKQIAQLLGRDLMSPAEYREALGMAPKAIAAAVANPAGPHK